MTLNIFARRPALLLAFDGFLRMGVGFLVAVAIAREYGPAGLGAITTGVAWVTVVLGFSALGLSGVMIRELVHRAGERGTLILSVTILKAAAGTLLYALLLGLLYMLQDDGNQVALLAAIMGLGFFFSALDPVDSLYNARKEFARLVFWRAMAMSVASLVKVGALYFDLGLELVAVGYAIDYSFVYLLPLLDFLVRRGTFEDGVYSLHADLRLAVVLVRESWPVLISGGFAQINLRIDALMLATISSLYSVGVYSAAARLSEAWSVLAMAIVTAAFPDLVRLAGTEASLYADKLRSLFAQLICISLVGAIGISLLSPVIVGAVYGDEYSASSTVLSIHVFGGVFLFIRTAVSRWLIVEKLLIFSLLSHGLGAALNVGLNLILIPTVGVNGAAITAVISYAASGLLFLALSRSTRPLLFLILWAAVPGPLGRRMCRYHGTRMPSSRLELSH